MKKLILILIPVFFISFLHAQKIEILKAPRTTHSPMFVNTNKQPVSCQQPPVRIHPAEVAKQKKWKTRLSQHGVNHGSDKPKSYIDSLKHAGELLKRENAQKYYPCEIRDESSRTGNTITPVVNRGFKGNTHNNWAPPDNSLAVSDDGFIVSVTNSNMFFSDANGQNIYEEDFADFLAFLQLNGGYFDPRVIYDPVEDKFIMVVLNGNTPATSTIVVGFSASSNPNDNWWFYTFPGQVNGSGLWFDYPSIGISTDDLYISGNMFTADNVSSGVMIYQINKGPGFTGANVTGVHWLDVRDAYGFQDYTIIPISFGFEGSVGPGIYMISTNGHGGYEATLYYTDNNSQSNPNIYAYAVTVPNYYVPFNGHMKGTTDQIKTGDCRALSGFYADGTIHFVYSNRGDDFHTRINYCRLNPNDLTTINTSIGDQPFEYAYPSIAPFATNETDKTVMIGFLRTSGSTYPSIMTITCDQDLNFSNAVMVREGDSFVNFDAGTQERWGDYSGISRRHTAGHPEVWMVGCYGEDNDNGAANVLGTWIAQITDGQVSTAPVAQFTANPVSIMAGQQVTFSDQSTNNPGTWSWTFPGGNPSESNLKNPVVTYENEGQFDVRLEVTNDGGNDVEIKIGYITVAPGNQMPVADFMANETNVDAGEPVQFQDQSQFATSWYWILPGGNPENSTLQNPSVVYSAEGCYEVTLVASNPLGTDVMTKTCYVHVLSTAVTGPDEVFDRFLLYPNPVSDGQVHLDFELKESTEMDFSVYDQQGRLIKVLLHRRIKQGRNELSFVTEALPVGEYLLVTRDSQQTVKTVKFIVSGT